MTLPTTNMGEIKSVKVDNWGVFFLQKLQNFFNKTDYCDLTLQFRDNSQLKVHRLVLSACTDYFNVLEQTCEVVDDAIIMPNGLQADVVVPIVNFMYTGTLEFELKMYNRLLRTAKDMNMTVLLKLLEAHRRTMEMHPQKTQMPTNPKVRRKPDPQPAANLPGNTGGRSLIQSNQGRRLVVGNNVNTNAPQQRGIPPGNTPNRLPTTGPLPVKQQIGSTTFTRIKQENEQDTNTPAQGGYTVLKPAPQQQQFQQRQTTPTSPFEQLRKGYNNNKRPAVSTFISPPAKKPNLEDVKEFAEQQRMRKQIAAEYGEDGDYDANNIMDDDNIHNDDDDDDMAGQTPTAQTTVTSASAGVQTSAQQQQPSEDPPGTTTIIVKHEGPDKPPTIVVKDNSNSKMNHAKIISEVLRQYPHLVRSNKNIKLKIMPNAGGQTQKIVVKKETTDGEKSPSTTPAVNKFPTLLPIKVENQPLKSVTTNIQSNKPKHVQQQSQPATKPNTSAQSVANKPQAATTVVAPTTAPGQPQKRRIDSKTMHSLIAMGAENTTGPWLCLRCGRHGHPISIPSYRGFRRHLINTHKETIDPALCEHCGWRSASKRELHFHMQLEHKVKTNLYIFPECQLCSQMCIDSDGLNQHLINSHPDENKQQCIYCNKIFPEELQLYTHMKTFHKKQALEDGIIDYSDDENNTDTLAMPTAEEFEQEMQGHDESDQQQQSDMNIKIISDISLPIGSSIIKTDSYSRENLNIAESATSVASEEYLHDHDHTETKFVAADGSEVILTDEQRKEILLQLNQEHEGSTSVVMVLNEEQQYVGGETQSEQDAISHDENSQGTTATNEEHEQEEDNHDDQIYNELKEQTSHIEEDSTSQTATAGEIEATNDEADPEEQHEHEEDTDREHEQEPQPGHMDESKESIDNLEWAENLISEHDLADEVSQTAAETTESNKPEENQEEPKDDDKSQDEISKKLKELTGDWSEDDDEDMAEEEPILATQPEKDVKEVVKEKETISTEDVEMAEQKEKTDRIEKEVNSPQEENKDKEVKPKKIATFKKEDKQETKKTKDNLELVEQDNDKPDADDIALALESLHKENTDDEAKEETLNKETEKENTKDIGEEKEGERKNITEKIDNLKQETEKKVGNLVKEEDKPKDTEIKLTEKSSSVEELKNIREAESSVMEVDEETKKDLIDSLLKEQPEPTDEETAIETITTGIKGDINIKDESKTTVEKESNAITENLTETEPSVEDEFLDIVPEKAVLTKQVEPLPSTSSTTEVVEDSSTTTTVAKSAISSEDQVKSLISEWGDDEDDDNDADLTADL